MRTHFRFFRKLVFWLTLHLVFCTSSGIPVAGQENTGSKEVPDVIPKALRNISIGMAEKDLLNQRPNIKKWFAPQGKEKAYCEQILGHELFSDAVYGILDGKVSFIALNGPADWMKKGKVESLLPSLLARCIAKYGKAFADRKVIEYRVATEAGTKEGVKCHKGVIIWKSGDAMEIVLLVPTPTALTSMEQVNDLALSKYRLVILTAQSQAGRTFTEPDKHKDEPELLKLVFDDLPLEER